MASENIESVGEHVSEENYQDQVEKDNLSEDSDDKDHVEAIIKEWQGLENFSIQSFFISLLFLALSVSDFAIDSLLGIEFLTTGVIFRANDTSDIPESCEILQNTNYTYPDYTEIRYYKDNSYTCNNKNRFFGFATLLIPFLPGLQWYMSLKTKHKIGRFLSSIFFPFFMVLFKVSHLSHQGSRSTEMNLLVNTCETINESMIQLILQVVIIFTSGANSDISRLQWVSLAKSLLLASKGPAEEFLAAGIRRASERDTTCQLFHERPLKENLCEIGKQLPFYVSLTTFRVLSMSLMIVAFGKISTILYIVLFVAIITIGYLRGSKEKDFIFRGIRSVVTTVDDRFSVERTFQIFWFSQNMIFMLIIGLNANFTKILFPVELEENIFSLNCILIVTLITGLLSFTMFFAQRNRTEEKSEKYDKEVRKPCPKKLFDNVLEDIKQPSFSCCSKKMVRRWMDVVFVLFDYPLNFYILFERINANSENPIWDTLEVLLCFLPGLEWYSYKHLFGDHHRLTWFLASFFFPFFVMGSRVVALFVGTDSMQELNLWMNGPRVQFNRMPATALTLFILIKVSTRQQEQFDIWLNALSLFIGILRTSWMTSEQMMMTRQTRANGRGNKDKFVLWPLGKRVKLQGKLFPFVLLFVVFRVLSFAFIVSFLRYYSIPLYALLIVGSILVGRRNNPNNSDFVMRGMKSVLSIVDERYEDEAPFQIFWFTINCVLTLILTFIFKMGREFFNSFSLLRDSNFKINPFDVLKVEELTLFENRSDLFSNSIGTEIQMFDITILLIFSTGILSLVFFFLMRHFKCSEIPLTVSEIQLEAKTVYRKP